MRFFRTRWIWIRDRSLAFQVIGLTDSMYSLIEHWKNGTVFHAATP